MAEPGETILVMEGISKAFPGVQALDDVSFNLRRGEIHCLVGENGAGKSTLMKVLTGVDKPDTGKILLDGQEIHARSPQHAQSLGISTVYQEINLCPNLSVAENVLIGREPHKFGRIDWKKMNALADETLQRLLGMVIDVTQPLGSYTVAIQQMVAIARALYMSSAKILILDEPTSSLDVHETEQLFKVMLKLKEQGVGIVFITHFIGQVFEDLGPHHRAAQRQAGWHLRNQQHLTRGADLEDDRAQPGRVRRDDQDQAGEQQAYPDGGAAAGARIWPDRRNPAVRPGSARRRSGWPGGAAGLGAHGDRQPAVRGGKTGLRAR